MAAGQRDMSLLPRANQSAVPLVHLDRVQRVVISRYIFYSVNERRLQVSRNNVLLISSSSIDFLTGFFVIIIVHVGIRSDLFLFDRMKNDLKPNKTSVLLRIVSTFYIWQFIIYYEIIENNGFVWFFDSSLDLYSPAPDVKYYVYDTCY